MGGRGGGKKLPLWVYFFEAMHAFMSPTVPPATAGRGAVCLSALLAECDSVAAVWDSVAAVASIAVVCEGVGDG